MLVQVKIHEPLNIGRFMGQNPDSRANPGNFLPCDFGYGLSIETLEEIMQLRVLNNSF